MKHPLKTLLFAVLIGFGAPLSAGPVPILENFPLISEPVGIEPAQEQRWTTPVVKPLNARWEGKRVGLHIRAFAKTAAHAGNWTMIMQIKINDTILERYNEFKQSRLVNRSDLKTILAGPNRKYSGTSWFNRYYKSWDVVYASDVRPGAQVKGFFQDDVTDYLFDIDDLVRVGAPFTVTVGNIADRNERLMQEFKQLRQTLPLTVLTAEVVVFENPGTRAARTKAVPPPADETIQAIRGRIPRMDEAAPDAVRSELLELSRAATIFSQYQKHFQSMNFQHGHLWIDYDSSLGKADKLIPLLDLARATGISVIRVPATWADVGGVSAFRPGSEAAEKDFRRLIDLCRERKLKLIVTISPALVKLNQEYRKEWEFSDPATAPGKDGRWGQVCTGSPEWRSFFFAEVQKLFDRCPVDGICVEPGINSAEETRCTQNNHVHPFRRESLPVVSALDMLTRLSVLCRKNGRLCYILSDNLPNLSSICDGQYIGQNTPQMRTYFNRSSSYTGNVWFLPMTRNFTFYSPREVYGSVMAAGHFPAFLYDERGDWKTEFQFYRCYLPLWQAMDRPGTHIYRNITATPLLKKISPQLTLTAFVNTSTYLLVNNSGFSGVDCAFTRELTDLETGETAKKFTVAERDFRIFLLPSARPEDAPGPGTPANRKVSDTAADTGNAAPRTDASSAAAEAGKNADDAPKSLMTPRRYRKRK